MQFPVIPDSSHASPALATLLDSFFTTKSEQDVEGWMSHFSKEHLFYTDAALGWRYENFESFKEAAEGFMPNWGTGKSYSTRFVGDETSGMAVVVDTPELFGSGIVILAPFDMHDGRVVRWADYWDGRNFGSEAAASMRTPADHFPATFGESETGEHAHPAMREVVDRLVAAFSTEDFTAISTMFTYDGIYEDLTLRSEVIGSEAISRYLGRAGADLPYARGTLVRHVVGSAVGGGFEWVNTTRSPNRGATMIELDSEGKITRFTGVWDGAMMSDRDIQSLASRAIDV